MMRTLLAAGAALGLLAAHASAADSLTVTYMESGTYDVAAKRIAEEFKQAKGVDVKVVAFPWAVLRQNNTTDLITGAGQYQVMSGGYYLADVYDNFAPLDDFIKKSDYAKGMIPGLMEPGRSEWYEGKQVGIPYGVDAYGLMVNKDLLDKAGVKPEFATWEAVLAACEKLKIGGPRCRLPVPFDRQPRADWRLLLQWLRRHLRRQERRLRARAGKGRGRGCDAAQALAAPAQRRQSAELRRGRDAIRAGSSGPAGRLAELLHQDAGRSQEVQDRRQVGHGSLPRPGLPLALALAAVRAQEHSGQGHCLCLDPGLRRARPTPRRTWSRTGSIRSGSAPTMIPRSRHRTPITGRP